LFVGTNAHATTLTSTVSVDNALSLYLSNNASTLGTLIGSVGSSTDTEIPYFRTSYSFSEPIPSNQTYYLQIVAYNWSGPAALLGDFTLSDSNFTFNNNSQSLLTNTSNWQVYDDSLGVGADTLLNLGTNSNPPGYYPANISGIDSSAEWIWTSNNPDVSSVRYFSTPIYSTGVVPEPATVSLLGLGALGLFFRRKKVA